MLPLPTQDPPWGARPNVQSPVSLRVRPAKGSSGTHPPSVPSCFLQPSGQWHPCLTGTWTQALPASPVLFCFAHVFLTQRGSTQHAALMPPGVTWQQWRVALGLSRLPLGAQALPQFGGLQLVLTVQSRLPTLRPSLSSLGKGGQSAPQPNASRGASAQTGSPASDPPPRNHGTGACEGASRASTRHCLGRRASSSSCVWRLLVKRMVSHH